MKKLIGLVGGLLFGLLVGLLLFASCEKEPITPEEPETLEVPCKMLLRVSGGGYDKAEILIMTPFRGSIYVENPTVGGFIRNYRAGIIDTSFVNPTITMYSKIVVNYGWGQIEK